MVRREKSDDYAMLRKTLYLDENEYNVYGIESTLFVDTAYVLRELDGLTE
jgi:hypothetical protein